MQLTINFFVLYQISQRDILNSIEREMSGDLREGMKTLGTSLTIALTPNINPLYSTSDVRA